MTVGAAAPDFVGVGVQKAGTSWWFSLIEKHPDYAPEEFEAEELLRRKETHFFDRFWADEFTNDSVTEYHSLFARPSGTTMGEWTPRYMFDPWTPTLLAEAAPEARILAILRDPVERYLSGLTHSLRYDPAGPSATIATDAFTRGLYSVQVERLYRAYPRHQVLLLQYERCIQEPERFVRETYAFVGLDNSFLPEDVRTTVLRTEGPKVEVSSRLRRELAAGYAPDLTRLATIAPTLDLDAWPTYDGRGASG